MDQVWQQLKQELEAQKTATEQWNPEPGEILLGTLLEVKTVEGEYGPCDLATLQEAETGKTIAVWLKHKILKQQWDSQNPQPGARIGIKYLGKQSGKTGQYHAYVLKTVP